MKTKHAKIVVFWMASDVLNGCQNIFGYFQ